MQKLARFSLTLATLSFGPGLFAQAPEGLPISAQLFTVRNAGTLDQQLAVIEQAGIKYVEPYRFWGMTEVPVEEMKAALARHHLKISGMHKKTKDLHDNVLREKAKGNSVFPRTLKIGRAHV